MVQVRDEHVGKDEESEDEDNYSDGIKAYKHLDPCTSNCMALEDNFIMW